MFIKPSYVSQEERERILERLWKKDPSLWAEEPEEREAVSNRLGWLDIFDWTEERLGEVDSLRSELVSEGAGVVLLVGMGGSSLAPLVFSRLFKPKEDHPRLRILDTTDPDEVESALSEFDWNTDHVIVASKSGTTLEPRVLFDYLWERAAGALGEGRAGSRFTAITDPGSPLEALSKERGFRRVFLNRPDLGGRYSALSFYGIVPAGLMGLDVQELLRRGREAAQASGPGVPWEENPAARLAEFLAEYGVQSRDKLTVLTDPDVKEFGLWLEQLVAESTGKETRGLVPIVGESPGIPGFYGGERIFAYLRLRGTPEEESLEGFVRELKEAEFPVYEIELRDLYDIGAQFFLWEAAVALASHFLAVNPFNEPDVVLAKERTKRVVEAYQNEGRMPVSFWVDPNSSLNFRTSSMLAASMKSLSRCLRDLFQVLPSWGYLAFLPYLPYEPEVEEAIGEMRSLVRQERGCATTLGFGPRYLHSTGQIYKGGPLSAGYIIITRKRAKDYPPVPGLGMSLWHLQFAQAAGDFEALSEARRRVIHLHLPADWRLGLDTFKRVFSRAVRL